MAVSRGKHTSAAARRGPTRYRTGSIDIVSSASICSEIRMIPNSAAIDEPARPVIMSAVSTGPSSRISDRATANPSTVSEPSRVST